MKTSAKHILKLSQLLRALHIAEQDGVVHLMSAQERGKAAWVAYLHVQRGSVIACAIQQLSDGRVLERDAAAMQWLETQEHLTWELENFAHGQSATSFTSFGQDHNVVLPGMLSVTKPETPVNTPKVDRAGEAAVLQQKASGFQMIPQRNNEQTENTAVWSREYRRVFALIDGQRTVHQIALLLQWSPRRVFLILRELAMRSLIEL